VNGRRVKSQLSFSEWTARARTLNALVTGYGVPAFNETRCEQGALAALRALFTVVVHTDCVTHSLRLLLASLGHRTPRIGNVNPGAGRENRNRTRYTWETISPCARKQLLERTRCDARWYSLLFADDAMHRQSWWRGMQRDDGS
jgi:hypothetical protein